MRRELELGNTSFTSSRLVQNRQVHGGCVQRVFENFQTFAFYSHCSPFFWSFLSGSRIKTNTGFPNIVVFNATSSGLCSEFTDICESLFQLRQPFPCFLMLYFRDWLSRRSVLQARQGPGVRRCSRRDCEDFLLRLLWPSRWNSFRVEVQRILIGDAER